MKHHASSRNTASELLALAEQAEVELAILLSLKQSLHVALQLMTRMRGNSHKLSTLRFTARSFERHLVHTRLLADIGGYMHAITDANPHLARDVEAMRNNRDTLQTRFERIIVSLEYVSPDDVPAFRKVCAELEDYLNDLEQHGTKELELLQYSLTQEQGGEG